MLGTGCSQRWWETQNNPVETPSVPGRRCLESGPHGQRFLQCQPRPRSTQGKLRLSLVARGLRQPGCQLRGFTCWGGWAFLAQRLCYSWEGNGAGDADPRGNLEWDVALVASTRSAGRQSFLLKAGHLDVATHSQGSDFQAKGGCHCTQTTAVVSSWLPAWFPAWEAASISGHGSHTSC